MVSFSWISYSSRNVTSNSIRGLPSFAALLETITLIRAPKSRRFTDFGFSRLSWDNPNFCNRENKILCGPVMSIIVLEFGDALNDGVCIFYYSASFQITRL
mmetsp:Transcript_24848/g.68507  ORF Transcript_24848/g.68507 Transcript_24848/m.68507 type:complete len:101 (+) Transcript_24848:682-984(+)